jgi:hypothetical protein
LERNHRKMASKMRLRSRNRERTSLHQHQRQPQREQHAHDDDGDEAHRAEGLALNVGDAKQEAYGSSSVIVPRPIPSEIVAFTGALKRTVNVSAVLSSMASDTTTTVIS